MIQVAGWTAFSKLERVTPLSPVIVITARPNQYRKAVQLGVDAFMEKPLNIPILVRAIQRLTSEDKNRHVRRITKRAFVPVKNGWDTFEQLTREHPLIPVIIATARPNQLFTALGAGAGALLEKPMDIPTLLRTMEKLLAETAEQRLARLAGQKAEFHYKPSKPRRD